MIGMFFFFSFFLLQIVSFDHRLGIITWKDFVLPAFGKKRFYQDDYCLPLKVPSSKGPFISSEKETFHSRTLNIA